MTPSDYTALCGFFAATGAVIYVFALLTLRGAQVVERSVSEQIKILNENIHRHFENNQKFLDDYDAHTKESRREWERLARMYSVKLPRETPPS